MYCLDNQYIFVIILNGGLVSLSSWPGNMVGISLTCCEKLKIFLSQSLFSSTHPRYNLLDRLLWLMVNMSTVVREMDVLVIRRNHFQLCGKCGKIQMVSVP